MQSESNVSSGKTLILIVDDEPLGREILEELLLPLECDLSFAGDGYQALEEAASLAPDLILLDVMMPGMDGFEVCRRLRADPDTADIPIILLTALDDRDSRLQGIEAGADDFISKPYDRVELRARVKTIVRLDRHRRLLTEQSKFEWAVKHADDGYLMVDGDDHILYANPRAQLYLDLPDAESDQQSRSFGELVNEQYLCYSARERNEAVSPSTAGFLVRPETETARAFWLQVERLDLPEGSTANHVIRLFDVTQRMTLQHDMRGFQRLVSHKLRTPLNGMHASLWLLSENAKDLSPGEVEELSRMAFESVERLLVTIEDIIRYAEASIQPDPEAKTGFKLAEFPTLVKQISGDLGLEQVSFSGVEALGHVLLPLSPQAVDLALREILENSAKFHPDQSPRLEITVTTPSPAWIAIQVADDGQSLSPEQMAMAFTPYYQGEKEFTGESSGTGLGLSTVSSLMRQAGGECSIRNRPDGPGVQVTLSLPVRDAGQSTL